MLIVNSDYLGQFSREHKMFLRNPEAIAIHQEVTNLRSTPDDGSARRIQGL